MFDNFSEDYCNFVTHFLQVARGYVKKMRTKLSLFSFRCGRFGKAPLHWKLQYVFY